MWHFSATPRCLATPRRDHLCVVNSTKVAHMNSTKVVHTNSTQVVHSNSVHGEVVVTYIH